MKINIWKVAAVGAAIALGFGSAYLFKLKNDNAIEEIAEEIIRAQTGLDIDITPLSDEDKPTDNVHKSDVMIMPLFEEEVDKE